MIRVIGFIFIISGAAVTGILQAASIRFNIRMFQDLRKALVLMKSEVMYSHLNIEKMSLMASGAVLSPLSELFKAVYVGISHDPTCSNVTILKDFFAHGSPVPAEMQDILLDLFYMLGRQDPSAQVRALELAESRVTCVLQQLETDREERCRSFRVLGICTGLALAVVLV